MIETALAIGAAAYAVEFLLLRTGLKRGGLSRGEETQEPHVSVVVAARDEEQHIGDCLDSLLRLQYPPEKLEIIVVNDRSADRTLEIAQERRRSHPQITVITASPGEGNLRGKTNAVARGIEAYRGDILMFTDADCTVPPAWVKETVRSFEGRAGIVGGFTMLEARRPFEGVQALDWIFLFGIASAASGLGMPLTAVGNNLAVRREAYRSTGGYKNIPFSVTEDYSLVRSILKRGEHTLRFPINPAAVVRSKACQTWKQLFRQKQRWGVGGFDMVAGGKIIMAIGWFLPAALLLGAGQAAPGVWAGAAACKVLTDLYFLWKPLKSFKALYLLKYFFLFELYFPLYVVAMPFVALLSRNVVWKERKF